MDLMETERIPHLPFFERLAELPESSPEWRRTKGALLVLRLVDSLYADPSAIDPWNVRAIRTAVDAIEPTDHVQALLAGILEAITRSNGSVAPGLLARLMAFGRAMDFSGEWNLASDVYRSVIGYCDPNAEGEIAIDASLRVGYCARMQGRWDVAMDAYLRAGRMADALGDRARKLRAKQQEAIVVRLRGNLPAAATLLDETIASCTETSDRSILAVSLHERAIVSFMRKQFEEGVELANRSLELEEDSAVRDRVLTDMASAFLELGIRSAARDAYLLVAATSQDQWARWLAAINLMELASIEGSEPTFQRYRAELGKEELPPPLLAGYLLIEGRALCLFGASAEGRATLERAVRIAELHSINDIYFRAQESLKKLPRAHQTRVAPVEPSPRLSAVADALREKREKAGV